MAPPPFSLKVRASKRLAIKSRTRPVNLPAEPPCQTARKPTKKSRRQNMKEKNPARYERNREMDKIRSQLYRLEMTNDERLHTNRLAAIRQKRYRQSKKNKDEALKKEKKKKNEKGTKRTTRSDQAVKELQKNKETERKRRYRQGQTKEEQEECNRKRREVYAAKKAKEQQERLKLKMGSTEPQLPAVQATHGTSDQSPSKTPSSSAAKRKRYSRLKKHLPSSGTHFAEVLASMVNTSSPQKVEALRRAGFKSKDGTKRRSLEKHLVDIVSKQANKGQGRKYVTAALNSLKRARLQRYASKTLGINRKAINKRHKEKQGRKPVTMETIKLVNNFFESMAHPLPDKKLVSKKSGKPQMVLTRPVGTIYDLFKKGYSEVKIGRSAFFKLRPRHVKPQSHAKYRGCLCEQCENVRLKVVTLDQRLQVDGHEELKLRDSKQTVKMTLCNKPEEQQFHQLKCIKRNCQQCGMAKFDNHFASLTQEERSRKIIWRKWDSVTTEQKATKKTFKRRALVNKEGTVRELLKELQNEVEAHALHLFSWYWQATQFQQIKSNLPKNWVLNVWDFAENYTCFEQNEAQSAYWTRNQVTVHPVVNYYKCESHGCTDMVCESVVFISSDNKHDFDAVHTYMGVLTSHLRQRRNIRIERMIRFSDGCAAQYKSRGPLADVAHSSIDYNFKTSHNFYGSRHGKGASDGESAVVKSQASMAVKSSTAVISSAKDLYDFCTANLERDTAEAEACTHFRRQFYFIDEDDIERDRKRCQIKTVPGTRSFHSVISIDEVGNTIKTRKLSCFCESCLSDGDRCKNTDYVEDWKVQPLIHKSKKAASSKSRGTKQSDEEASNQSDEEASNQSDEEASNQSDEEPTNQSDEEPTNQSDEEPTNQSDEEPTNQSDEEPTNHSDETSDAGVSRLQGITTGSYVAVQLQPVSGRNRRMGRPHVYIASVLEDLGNTNYKVSFMKQNRMGLYIWPEIPDTGIHPKSDFVGLLSQPDVGGDRRSLVFKFPEGELEDLARTVNGCLK